MSFISDFREALDVVKETICECGLAALGPLDDVVAAWDPPTTEPGVDASQTQRATGDELGEADLARAVKEKQQTLKVRTLMRSL